MRVVHAEQARAIDQYVVALGLPRQGFDLHSIERFSLDRDWTLLLESPSHSGDGLKHSTSMRSDTIQARDSSG